MNANEDGENAELSNKRKMSTAALIVGLNMLLEDQMYVLMENMKREDYRDLAEILKELYDRHVYRPIAHQMTRAEQ